MRLITRSDFDGLVSAVLLKEVEKIDSVEFAHPKDVQDGKVKVGKNDILTNLPFAEGVGMWFDHHMSESKKSKSKEIKGGRFEVAPSAARVIVNHYGEERFSRYYKMLESCDRVDSAQLSFDDILNPQGWILLSYVMDARTGLGYNKDYKISNQQLMHKMIDLMSQHSLDYILNDPDVKERISRYKDHFVKFNAMMRDHSKLNGDCVITDLRGMEVTTIGNRFHIYTLYPEANISMRVLDGKGKETVVIALGHNILNRTSKINVGDLLAEYGGGGHFGAGTCQVAPKQSEKIIKEILSNINKKK
jgi:oligoribonuclease NrnB/cAMP/cGMP phosphodiesterase (DHH superfamily)